MASSSTYYYKRRSKRRSLSLERDRTPKHKSEVLKKCSLEDPFTIRERLQKLEQQMFERNMQLETITHISTILDLKYTGFIHKLNTHIKTRKKLLEIIKNGRSKQNESLVDPGFSAPKPSSDVLINIKETEKQEKIDINPSTSTAPDYPRETKETEKHEKVLTTVADAKNKFPSSSTPEVLEGSVKETDEDKKPVVDENAKEPTQVILIPRIEVSTYDESSTNLGPQDIVTYSLQDVREPQEVEVTEPAIGEFEITITDISNILEYNSVQGLLELSVEQVVSDDTSKNIIVAVQDVGQVFLLDEKVDISITASTESDNPIDVSPSVEDKSDISIAASTELDVSLEVEESSSEDVIEQVPSKIHETAAKILKDLLGQALQTVYKTSKIATDGTKLNVIDESSSSKELKESSSGEILVQASEIKETDNISKELLKQALITVYQTSNSATVGTDSNVQEVEESTLKEELKQALTSIDDTSDVSLSSKETDSASEDEKRDMNFTYGKESNILQDSEKAQSTIDETDDIIVKEVLQQALTKVDETSDINVIAKTDEAQTVKDEITDIIITEVVKGGIIVVGEGADICVTSTGSDSSKDDEESSSEEVTEQVLPAPDKKDTTRARRKSKIPAPAAVPSSSKTGERDPSVKCKKKISGKRYGFTPEYNYRLDLFEEFLKNEITVRSDHNEPTERVSLKIAIWDHNPMDDNKVAILRQALIVEAKDQFRCSSFRPEFEKLESKKNCLNVICNNELTLDWVKAITKRLDLWEDIQLEIKDQEPPRPLLAILHVKTSEAKTAESATNLLKSQNPELNVHEWKMYHSDQRPSESLLLVFFAIPESSLKVLEKNKHWVYLGKTKTYVQVYLGNREMKVPIKLSKKPRLQGDVLCGFRQNVSKDTFL